MSTLKICMYMYTCHIFTSSACLPQAPRRLSARGSTGSRSTRALRRTCGGRRPVNSGMRDINGLMLFWFLLYMYTIQGFLYICIKSCRIESSTAEAPCSGYSWDPLAPIGAYVGAVGSGPVKAYFGGLGPPHDYRLEA